MTVEAVVFLLVQNLSREHSRIRYAVEAAKAGYFFSVPPIVCRSDGFQKLVKALPLESLLLETDSPALVSFDKDFGVYDMMGLSRAIGSVKGLAQGLPRAALFTAVVGFFFLAKQQ